MEQNPALLFYKRTAHVYRFCSELFPFSCFYTPQVNSGTADQELGIVFSASDKRCKVNKAAHITNNKQSDTFMNSLFIHKGCTESKAVPSSMWAEDGNLSKGLHGDKQPIYTRIRICWQFRAASWLHLQCLWAGWREPRPAPGKTCEVPTITRPFKCIILHKQEFQSNVQIRSLEPITQWLCACYYFETHMTLIRVKVSLSHECEV